MRIERFDERFTSVIAHQTMIDAGLKKSKRQDKELVDTISATLILQSYMTYVSSVVARYDSTESAKEQKNADS